MKVVILFILLLFSLNLFAQKRITTVDTTEFGLGASTSIALGLNGNPVIAYFDLDQGLKFIHCTSVSCNTHDDPIILDSGIGEVGQYPTIQVGIDFMPVISYSTYDGSEDTLKIIRCTSIDCSTHHNPVVIYSQSLSIRVHGYVLSKMILTSDNYPVIAYSEGYTIGIRLAVCQSVNCDTISYRHHTTGGKITYLDVVLSGINPLLIYARDRANGGDPAKDLISLYCVDSLCNGAVTRKTIFSHLESISQNMLKYPKVIEGNNGYPLIVFNAPEIDMVDNFGQSVIKLVSCLSERCLDISQANTIVTTTPELSIDELSLSSGINDNPMVLYRRSNGNYHDLNIINCLDSVCNNVNGLNKLIIDETNPDGLSYIDLRKNNLGNPVISYYDNTGKNLNVLNCGDEICESIFGNGFETIN